MLLGHTDLALENVRRAAGDAPRIRASTAWRMVAAHHLEGDLGTAWSATTQTVGGVASSWTTFVYAMRARVP
jgi:hypothetical protein